MKHPVSENIYWVGALEWSIEHFHGHELSIRHGTSYNSYLIDDEKKILIDLVKYTHFDTFVKNIEEICPVSELDYLIINHAEPDHASSLPLLMAKNPNLKIISSKGGKISISRHHPDYVENLETVKTGDTLNTGKYNLKFFEAQMLHWPDTMFTYVEEQQLLMSADAFGQHFASSQLFADQIDRQGLWFEAEKYFANILTPYSKQIVRKIEEFMGLGWPVKIIAPAHGVVWRKEPEVIINKYLEWAAGVTTDSAVVIFDTIWGSTEKMAKAVCRGLDQEGVSYKMFSAGASDLNDVMTEILTTKAVIVGSPTLNNGIMPSLAPFLEELRGLRFQKKIGAAYGTYGWSGECIKRIEESLELAHIEVAIPGLKFQFNAHDADLEKCVEFGREMGRKIKEANSK